MSESDDSKLQFYRDALCRRIDYLHKEVQDLKTLLNPYDVYGSRNSIIYEEIDLLRRELRKITLERDDVVKEIRLRQIQVCRAELANLQAMFEKFYKQQVKE